MGTFNRRLWSSVLSFLLMMTGTQALGAEDQQAPPGNSSGATGQGMPLTEQELNNLVSPIALYPDALVAQIVAASTFPDQVAVADNWLQQNTSLTGSGLMQAVNGEWESECEGADAVSVRVEQHGTEPGMDIAVGRGVSQSALAGFRLCASRPKQPGT